MSGDYPVYRSEFEAWLTDIASLGLTPDLALTSYDGRYPSSSTEYRTKLEEVLNQAKAIDPIRYLEAWNEPNNQGNVSALDAANFTNSASATCGHEYGCAVIAGNFEDGSNTPTYEKGYLEQLNPIPHIWGVHPYHSVEEMSEGPFLAFWEHLPNRGVGEQIWFTEIAARKCSDFNGHVVENGEKGQSERADWLVNTLMKNAQPEHVFYYEFLLGDRREPSCQSEGSDGALYLPSGEGSAADRPRPAASYIWDGGRVLGELPEGAFAANAAQTTLTGGVEL
jgi:Glycosyl hydrolase catalytic core